MLVRDIDRTTIGELVGNQTGNAVGGSREDSVGETVIGTFEPFLLCTAVFRE
jgi:hypothetical protein